MVLGKLKIEYWIQCHTVTTNSFQFLQKHYGPTNTTTTGFANRSNISETVQLK